MLYSRDREKTLFEMCSISNVFLKVSKTGHLITFMFSDQHRAERDSQLISSDPGAVIETEHIDQVFENSSAFTLARPHLADSNVRLRQVLRVWYARH